MADTFRALCAELIASWDADGCDWKPQHQARWEATVNRARAALADGPAVPEGREPAAVTGQPSDEEWDALVERVWDKYQTVGYQGERFMYDGDFGSALDLVRKELSRWGNPAPAPPVEGEWQTGLPPSPGFYYVRDLLHESIGGDNRPVYVNPKHFVWGFWEQDDPERIGLDSDITPDNIQWKPVAPLPSPVADGEVAELVAWLRSNALTVKKASGNPANGARQRMNRAAELLQRQAPQPPADGEVVELAAWLRSTGEGQPCLSDEGYARLTRAAELLQRLNPPQPVPVSERLPGPKDCAPWPQPSDKSGWCWMSRTIHGFYGSFAIWEQVSVVPTCREVYTHWLPAHALPLPEMGE